jgi:hypothetical protein
MKKKKSCLDLIPTFLCSSICVTSMSIWDFSSATAKVCLFVITVEAVFREEFVFCQVSFVRVQLLGLLVLPCWLHACWFVLRLLLQEATSRQAFCLGSVWVYRQQSADPVFVGGAQRFPAAASGTEISSFDLISAGPFLFCSGPRSLSSVRFTSLGFSWSLCAPRGSQHRPSLDFCHASVFVFLSSIASVLSQILGHGIRRISPGRGILLLILLRLCQFACRTFSQVLQAICFLLCRSSISIFPLLVDCCRVEAGLALKPSDQKS